MSVDVNAVKNYLLGLQDSICDALSEEDSGKVFLEDSWERPAGGGGRSRGMEEGAGF